MKVDSIIIVIDVNALLIRNKYGFSICIDKIRASLERVKIEIQHIELVWDLRNTKSVQLSCLKHLLKMATGKKNEWLNAELPRLRINNFFLMSCNTNCRLYKLIESFSSTLIYDTQYGNPIGKIIHYISRATKKGHAVILCRNELDRKQNNSAIKNKKVGLTTFPMISNDINNIEFLLNDYLSNSMKELQKWIYNKNAPDNPLFSLLIDNAIINTNNCFNDLHNNKVSMVISDEIYLYNGMTSIHIDDYNNITDYIISIKKNSCIFEYTEKHIPFCCYNGFFNIGTVNLGLYEIIISEMITYTKGLLSKVLTDKNDLNCINSNIKRVLIKSITNCINE